MTQALSHTINSRIQKTDLVAWRTLSYLQQDDFKELSTEDRTKLKTSLVANHFIQPFYVWLSPDGILYCLDGRHRTLILEELVEEGAVVPAELPAVYIDCADMKEAAKLVLVFSSAYARVTQQGLFDFLTLNDLDWRELREEVSISSLSVDRFEQKFDVLGFGETIDEEELPEIVDLVVKPGDIFQLGSHTIACTSFTDEPVIANIMQGRHARIVFCDPPYNLPANFYTSQDTIMHADFAMAAGEMSDEEFSAFLASVMNASCNVSLPGAIHYICMDFRHVWHMTDAARTIYGSPQPKQVCVWYKDLMGNGSFYRPKHELVFLFQNGNAQHLWNNDLLDNNGFYKDNQELVFIFKNGDAAPHLSHLDMKDRIRTNVWNYPSAISTANPDRYELKNHPTPKPVAMIADAIQDTTNMDDCVVDWFLGSGSTLIACEKTGRICLGTEIEPKYIQHIICRYYRWCRKNNREPSFVHINGELKIEDILATEVES